MGLKPGYLVSKHVQLVRELKRGGMGSVWIADHLALNTQVAVKFMAASIVDDAAAVARFAREATSAAQIKSPHVVQIHDHGVTTDGLPFMVMELLHGEDVSTRIKRVGQMPLEEAAQIVLQVCRVLSRAHRAGIVHRDIKPSNIFLIDTDGEIFVKVLDFGVAKLGDDGGHELTTTGAMVGTLVYMSPEQLLSARSVDHRADLWSLGVVVYRAITGELPFKNDDGLGALCRAVENGSFAAPSTLAPGIGPEVDAWFERAFAVRLEDRFRSAKTMSDALQVAMGRLELPPPSLPSSLRSAGLAGLAGGESTLSELVPSAATRPASQPRLAGLLAAAARSEDKTVGAEPTAAAPALTLAGTASTPPPLVRSRVTSGRVAAGVVLALVSLAGLGGVGALRGWPPFRRGAVAAAATPSAVPVADKASAPAASAPGPALTTSANPEVIPARSISSAAPSTSSSAAPSASSSAAPSSAAGKGRGRQGGPRPGPEKDYGF